MVLSDRTIARLLAEGRIEIDPYDESLLQPSSVDVRVDRYFRVFRNNLYPHIDVKVEQDNLTELVEIGEEPFILHPGEFVLGSTLERVKLPDDLVARLEGKSSLGRLGLLIHSTAGFIDPGWDGHVTLELSNVANLPITIYHGMKIGQLSFVQLTEPASAPYGSDGIRLEVPGAEGADAQPLLEELRAVILVTGATGFVGPKVVHALRAAGHDVRALVRDRGRGQALEAWGAELAQGDVTNPDSLRAAAAGADTVVHLVAIRQGRPEQFQRVMVQGTRNLIAAAQEAGAKRFVLMSALGTDESTKDLVPYYGAKWQQEQDVQASGLPHVIFRPSFVFGRDGGILPTFARLAKLTPATPIIGSGQAADPADLGRRRRRVLREGRRPRRGDEPDLRARRPGRGQLERVLGAAQAGARAAPPELPRPDRAHAPERARDRAAAREHPAHARPAEDARGRRQRRLEHGRGRDLPAAARAARRATPPRRLERGGCRLAP